MPAKAQTISSVGGTSITKGQIQTETRFGFSQANKSSSQDNRLRLRQHFDYGVTNNYAFRLILSQDDRKGDSIEHDNITVENRFHIFEQRDHGFDLGLRLFYTYKDGDKKPDIMGARLIQTVSFDDWEARFNQFFRSEVGQNSRSGLRFESRVQITKKIEQGYRIGVDSFNNVGNLRDLSGYSSQQHAVGPVIKGKIGDLNFETSYIAGISKDSLNHGYKFFLSRKF